MACVRVGLHILFYTSGSRHRPPACSKKMRPSNRLAACTCSALTITVCSFSVSYASPLRQLSISWIRHVGLSTRKRASPTTTFNILPEFTLKSGKYSIIDAAALASTMQPLQTLTSQKLTNLPRRLLNSMPPPNTPKPLWHISRIPQYCVTNPAHILSESQMNLSSVNMDDETLENYELHP